jgi:hypothetical protein
MNLWDFHTFYTRTGHIQIIILNQLQFSENENYFSLFLTTQIIFYHGVINYIFCLCVCVTNLTLRIHYHSPFIPPRKSSLSLKDPQQTRSVVQNVIQSPNMIPFVVESSGLCLDIISIHFNIITLKNSCCF